MKSASKNKINSIALSYNLHQLIDEATHYTENSSSLIDLIFVSKPDNVLYSDVISPFIPDLVRYHCPVTLTLNFRKPVQKSFTRHIWLYERGDYIKYRRLLDHTDWSFISPENNLNEIAIKVTDLIIKAAKESIPNKTVTVRPNEPQWITSFIKRQIRQRKRLFRIAKRVDSEHAWAKFKQKRNSVTAIIRQAKKDYNDKLANELRQNQHNSKLWYKVSAEFLKTSPHSNSIPYLESDNKLAETDIEKAEVLNQYFASQSTINDINSSLPDLDLPNHPQLETINISQEDVKAAISSLKPHKAPGPNSVSPKLIKEAKNELSYAFSKLFNLSLTLKEFPDFWKQANVTAVHKKDDRCLPNNYRPISLLNCEGKLMERCVHKYVSQYLKHHSIITEFQSGFQSGDSTVNQLTYLYNEFSKALDENKEVRVVFLDISKAFDRVWHKGLLAKLTAIGFSKDMTDWFNSYLTNRLQRVCIRGVSSSWQKINAGVPQGSILGPTLFLIFINDIVNRINSNTRLFADDTILYKVINQPISAGIELNIDLENISKWASEWLVSFQPTKTKSLIISKKRHKVDHPVLIMNQTRIDEVSQHKHLGIVLSDDLSWTNHIETISAKAWQRIGLLRRYKFLLDRASLQKMYVSFIRPLLEYGDIIWDNCTAANKRALENIQVEALRITTGGTKVCSIQKLYDDSNWETLQTRRNNHKLCQLYKMINGLTPNYLYQLLPSRVHQASRYPLRNSSDFSVPASRTTTYCNSFLPMTLKAWNALNQDIRNAPSLGIFKKKIRIPMTISPRYFDTIQLSRKGQILHARIRLECSSLNQHLFKKNLVSSPLCSCGQPETSSHFLLFCTNYNLLRQRYLSVLPHRLSLSLLLNGDPNEPEVVNNIIFKHVQLYILSTKRFA
ncbi:MAG: reverse transcriptase family protein [Candidatus Thiodiazotropha sp.]